jgi:hypothetical protein
MTLLCCWRCDRPAGDGLAVWDWPVGPFCSRLCLLATKGERDG